MFPEIDVTQVPARVLAAGNGIGSLINVYNAHVRAARWQQAAACLTQIDSRAVNLSGQVPATDEEGHHYVAEVLAAVQYARSNNTWTW
jgi:hypothetical protein